MTSCHGYEINVGITFAKFGCFWGELVFKLCLNHNTCVPMSSQLAIKATSARLSPLCGFESHKWQS